MSCRRRFRRLCDGAAAHRDRAWRHGANPRRTAPGAWRPPLSGPRALVYRGDRRLHFALLFTRQLPAHVHRTIFFTRDDGRVVVQLPDNYPADSHSACKII